jgi:hypothetical protein
MDPRFRIHGSTDSDEYRRSIDLHLQLYLTSIPTTHPCQKCDVILAGSERDRTEGERVNERDRMEGERERIIRGVNE